MNSDVNSSCCYSTSVNSGQRLTGQQEVKRRSNSSSFAAAAFFCCLLVSNSLDTLTSGIRATGSVVPGARFGSQFRVRSFSVINGRRGEDED